MSCCCHRRRRRRLPPMKHHSQVDRRRSTWKLQPSSEHDGHKGCLSDTEINCVVKWHPVFIDKPGIVFHLLKDCFSWSKSAPFTFLPVNVHSGHESAGILSINPFKMIDSSICVQPCQWPCPFATLWPEDTMMRLVCLWSPQCPERAIRAWPLPSVWPHQRGDSKGLLNEGNTWHLRLIIGRSWIFNPLFSTSG